MPGVIVRRVAANNDQSLETANEDQPKPRLGPASAMTGCQRVLLQKDDPQEYPQNGVASDGRRELRTANEIGIDCLH